MMGAARRQQHVFRRLGNQIGDSPSHQHLHIPDLPKLSQVWKPAPTTHKQDLSTHQSTSPTAALASLVEASPGNLKKNDDGCSETTAARVSASRQPNRRQPTTSTSPHPRPTQIVSSLKTGSDNTQAGPLNTSINIANRRPGLTC